MKQSVCIPIYMLTYVILALMPVRQKLTVTGWKQSHACLPLKLKLAATECQSVLSALIPVSVSYIIFSSFNSKINQFASSFVNSQTVCVQPSNLNSVSPSRGTFLSPLAVERKSTSVFWIILKCLPTANNVNILVQVWVWSCQQCWRAPAKFSSTSGGGRLLD